MTSERPAMDEKRMRLRYAGTCGVCSATLRAGSEAIYEKATRTVRCIDGRPARVESMHSAESPAAGGEVEIDAGVPGRSARREFERRRDARERRVREKHRRIGGLILAVSDDPQATRAWDIGAIGEERLGSRLNELVSHSVRVLHDRRVHGSRANIDHIVVTTSGIYVVDAKRYRGCPTLKVEGGILRPRVERLLVGRRDCTKVVDGVLKQVEVVRGVVGGSVTVRGVLRFVEADWHLIGGSFATRGVEVLSPKRLYPKLESAGPLSVADIDGIHQALSLALPPA